MRNAALAEKRALALVSAIDELIDEDESARRQVFAKRTACRQRYQIGDTGPLEDVDISPIVDIGWGEAMTLIVTRKKHDRQAADLTDAQWSGRLAPRAGNALLAHVRQT